MTERLPIDVFVLKNEHEVFSDHPAIIPTVYADGAVEIPVEIWSGNTVFVRFNVADLVRYTINGMREAEDTE